MTETQGHAGRGSDAEREQRRVTEQIAPGYPSARLLVSAVLQRYTLAASEQFGGLAALYEAQEVLYSPSAIARSILEHCASIAWVLGADEGSAEDRLARAYREELKSAEEAKKNAGRILGKGHPEYVRVAGDFKRLREEIEHVFPDGWTVVDRGVRLLHGQRLPGPEEGVTWLLSEFLTRPQAWDVARGTYGYVSNMTHPTLYRISGLWSVEERDGERVAVLGIGVEDHDKLAQLIISPYYEVMARVIAYHGWPGGSHDELTGAIDHLLPGMFPSASG